MIPKILHRVWLGGEEPEEVKRHWKIAKKLNPGWTFLTHGENNIDEFPLSKKYLNLSEKYSFKSDLIRFEAIYKYGGFYIDTDVEVIKSFDDLINTDKIVAAYEDLNYNVVGTATFGAPPKKSSVINAFNYMVKKARLESQTEKGFILNPNSKAFAPHVLGKLWINNPEVDLLEYYSFFPYKGSYNRNLTELDLVNTYSIHKSYKSWA